MTWAEISQIVLVCGILIACVWIVYRAGIVEGKYRERMSTLDILHNLQTADMTATTKYHVLCIVTRVIHAMNKE